MMNTIVHQFPTAMEFNKLWNSELFVMCNLSSSFVRKKMNLSCKSENIQMKSKCVEGMVFEEERYLFDFERFIEHWHLCLSSLLDPKFYGLIVKRIR